MDNVAWRRTVAFSLLARSLRIDSASSGAGSFSSATPMPMPPAPNASRSSS
jgi:hypothetical protein